LVWQKHSVDSLEGGLLAKPSAADGIELRPQGTETVASLKMQAVLKILVPVISAAILIWLLVIVYSARR